MALESLAESTAATLRMKSSDSDVNARNRKSLSSVVVVPPTPQTTNQPLFSLGPPNPLPLRISESLRIRSSYLQSSSLSPATLTGWWESEPHVSSARSRVVEEGDLVLAKVYMKILPAECLKVVKEKEVGIATSG